MYPTEETIKAKVATAEFRELANQVVSLTATAADLAKRAMEIKREVLQNGDFVDEDGSAVIDPAMDYMIENFDAYISTLDPIYRQRGICSLDKPFGYSPDGASGYAKTVAEDRMIEYIFGQKIFWIEEHDKAVKLLLSLAGLLQEKLN